MPKELPIRKSIRLPNYDYSQDGYYFVTICTKDRRCILGSVVGAGVLDSPQIILSEYGKLVEEQIGEIGRTSSSVKIDKYVIMPNHIHFIVAANGSSRTPTPTNAALPTFVSLFKRFTNRKCSVSLWQRGYYDHIIRNDADHLRIWQYIDENPAKWAEDEYYA